MISGLLPLGLVAKFLGKRVEEMPMLIAEDGLPVIHVPTARKQVRKVSIVALHKWLKKRSANSALTLEELEQELERVSRSAKLKPKQRVKEAVCDAGV